MKRFLEKFKFIKFFPLDIVFVTIFFLITNRRTWLCINEINQPLFYCEYGSWIDEIKFLILLVAIAVLTLLIHKQFKDFLRLWKSNWLLLAFLIFGIASFAWSISSLGTLRLSLQLILSTIIAAYVGFRFSRRQILQGIFVFTVLLTFFSYLLILILPGAAIMTTYPHEGAWRGIFSHRNYLGSIAAFGSVIAAITFIVDKKPFLKRILALLVFIGLFVLILLSDSATGLILMIILNLLLLLVLGWINMWPKVSKWLKVGILSGGLIFAITMLLNLEKLLGLIGRNTSLTGRTPLWKYLIDLVAEHNLWLGYGLGTVWFSKAFRLKTAEVLGWPFQVVNGHNGFIDIFIYLGLIGLILLVVLLAYILFVTLKHFVKNRTVLSLFPFITIIYVLIANITISFLFEFETFHWCLLILFLFQITSQNEEKRERLVSAEDSVQTNSSKDKQSELIV